MTIDRATICDSANDWVQTSNNILDATLSSIDVYIGDTVPPGAIINILIVDNSFNQTYYSNPVEYVSGTTLINAQTEWLPPDSADEGAIILCDDIFSEKVTLQGNTQHGYRQFSNITLADL